MKSNFKKHLIAAVFIFSLPQALVASNVLKITTVPENPKQGEAITVFLQPTTMLSKTEYVFEASVENLNVNFIKTGEQLWSAQIRPFHEIKNYTLSVDIFVQSATEAQRIRIARNTLINEIKDIVKKLETETNPEKITRLETDRDLKQSLADQLLVDLGQLKKSYRTESVDFKISPNPENSDYPTLTAVNPAVVTLGQRTVVTITGSGFVNGAIVKMGGQNGTIQSMTPTEMTVLAPNFSTSGAKDIEIIIPAASPVPRKNAYLSGQFFATSETILKNLRPTAVTTGFLRVVQTTPAPVTLNATSSYDDNGDALDYEWTINRVPTGSTIPIGTVLANSPTPTFTPDLKGIYTIRMRVRENNTAQQLYSLFNTFTVEVK